MTDKNISSASGSGSGLGSGMGSGMAKDTAATTTATSKTSSNDKSKREPGVFGLSGESSSPHQSVKNESRDKELEGLRAVLKDRRKADRQLAMMNNKYDGSDNEGE